MNVSFYNAVTMAEETVTAKPKIRTKRTSLRSPTSQGQLPAASMVAPLVEIFDGLTNQIAESKRSLLSLEQEIHDTYRRWEKEQEEHRLEIMARMKQEERERQREREQYDYELKRERKAAEDEFIEKKARWERELAARKEELDREHAELVELRKTVASFDREKEKTAEDARNARTKELTGVFETERKLSAQQNKAEKDLFALRIETFTNDNERLRKEVTALKQALEEATRQLKEIAVEVISSTGSSQKQSPPS